MMFRKLTALSLPAALALIAGVFVSVPAWSDMPGKDWMPKAELEKKMSAEGYSSITAEADDGHWEGEAVKDGKIVEFHADAHTGKVTKSVPKSKD